MSYNLNDYLGKEIQCSCGMVHKTPLKKIDIGQGALKRLPSVIRELGYQKVFMVADVNTYKAAAAEIEALFQAEKMDCETLVLNEEEPVPDEASLGRILAACPRDTDVILAVGTGTINDMCKYISCRLKLDYIIAATAPSMDGFVSVGAALMLDHVKVTCDAHSPVAVIGDTDILAEAPMNLITAGLGDVLGKYTCIMDWKLAHLINGEYYCEAVVDMVNTSVQTVVSQGKNIKTRDPQAVKALMEALVLTGMAMYFVGNSRPASGCEHHMSHFWEMRFLMEGKKPVLHGTKVGIGMVTAVKMYHMLAEEQVDFETAMKKKRSYGEWEEKMKSCYLTAADGIIRLEQKCGKNDIGRRSLRVETMKENWEEIQKTIEEGLPKVEEVKQLLESLDAPVHPDQVGLSLELVKEGIQAAKEVRDRYTLLQILWDLGLEEEYSRRMITWFQECRLSDRSGNSSYVVKNKE